MALLDLSGSSLGKPHSNSLSLFDLTQNPLTEKIPIPKAFVKKQSEQNRRKLIDTENKLVLDRREGKGGWAKSIKGIKKSSYKINKSQDVVYNTGNIINNTVITLYGDRW